jgi:acyl-CoA dehydrogenase
MRYVEEMNIPFTELSGCDADLTEEERAVQQSLRRFSLEVLRPNGVILDKMSSEEMIAPGSPFWDVMEQYKSLGFDYKSTDGMDRRIAGRMTSIMLEELSWGDIGLAFSALAAGFPDGAAHGAGRDDLADWCAPQMGCWIITQPDRGSDSLQTDARDLGAGGTPHRGNLAAKWMGDHVVLNGQSSAWVSGAPVATCAIVQVPCDYGDGYLKEDGSVNGVSLICDLTKDGVSKGKPLDKLGQRNMSQGEVFFDDVRVEMDNVLWSHDDYQNSVFSMLTDGNMSLGSAFVGLAQSALDHTIDYVHERKQGGVTLMEHQHVRHRVYKLFEKVEAARALGRRVMEYNYAAPSPHLMYSVPSKVFCGDVAVEVTNEAMQLFGGNGLTREYPMEKLMRDARPATVEDGENHILGLMAATWMTKLHEQSN